MDKFKIKGGNKLAGKVIVSGSKNAALPIMAATILAKGKTVLKNIPHLNDIKMMAHLLRIIGARVNFIKNTMEIDTTHCSFYEAPYELVSKMRASVYVLGPLLARFGKAKVSFPGGCAIGTRPVDMHLQAMESLGANIEIEHGYILADTKKLKGNRIDFRKVSVGATANTIMAAVLAEGTTEIMNAAQEPEIDSLINFLNRMGAKIKRKGDRIEIDGVDKLQSIETEIVPDRIEAGTFLIAAAITKSEITLENAKPDELDALITKLEQTGCKCEINNKSIKLIPAQTLKPIAIVTKPYPGFPTDLQAQFTSLLCFADGVSHIKDTIFPDRFMHVAELNRLEAKINVEDGTAEIQGVEHLSGANVMATDLRASAALVLAGLAAKGETIVSRIYHIDRGYEKIEQKLQKLGADIERIIG